MRIDGLWCQKRPTLSFEFFPPKNEAGFAQLYAAIGELYALHPSYVSVTYGAGGSTRSKTVDLVGRIQTELNLRAMAHLTCVGHSVEELEKILDDLWAAGVFNVLALRGDTPVGQSHPAKSPALLYANELVKLARGRHDFCIGVAGYPEGHPQCLNRTRDLENLKRKVDEGANFIVTQLFFDNDDFYRFGDEVRRMKIDVPIIAGIMPILNVQQIKRFITLCGARIPHPLLLKLEAAENEPQTVYELGVEHALNQCRDLLAKQTDGIHFYTLNRSRATVDICRKLQVPHAH